MKVTKLSLAFASMALVFGACNCGTKTITINDLKTSTDTASYYIGYFYGQSFSQMGIEPNMQALISGIKVAMQKDSISVSVEDMNAFLMQHLQALADKSNAENLVKGQKFLEETAKNADVKTLEGGILYKVITEGTGEKPQVTDKVKVHYRGTLIDGTEFDSSIKRGEPMEFTLDGVIKGWTTALQQMPVGSKWTLYIPSDLAYGPSGYGPIKPNEVLIFDIELIEIVK